jgi:hypothetical protein
MLAVSIIPRREDDDKFTTDYFIFQNLPVRMVSFYRWGN